MKKVLIFYSNTGGGHLRTAEAISEELKRKGVKTVLVDGLEENSLGIKVDPGKVFKFISLYTIFLYNFFFSLSDNLIGARIIWFLFKISFGRKLQEIIKENDPDLIVSTHFAINAYTTGSDKNIPFVSFVIDLVHPHQSLFDASTTALIVPTKDLASYIKQTTNIPKERIYPLGYPLLPNFKPDISSKTDQLLILGGGSGSGGLESIVLSLAKAFVDKKIVVICGDNQILRKKLESLKLINTEIFGFADNIAKLMKQSDIVITKAGPVTIMEAASLGKPLIITSWVGLQEKDNVDFVKEKKLGLPCFDANQLPNIVNKIYTNYSIYSQGDKKVQNRSEEIAEFLTSLI